MIEVLILSLIQGVTEFLPISSSSHLIIISDYINLDNQNLINDVSLHIGSFFAVLIYFYNDIKNFLKNKELFFKIFISSIPTMVVGYFLAETGIIYKLRNIEVISWMTLLFGILLFVSDKFKLNKEIERDFNYKSALFIGALQVLSLIPGVSRSGIAITAARFLKFKRFDALRISFLLSIPTLAAVTLYGLKNIFLSQRLSLAHINVTYIILSFFFSFITIKFFLSYVKRFNLNIFVIYRIVLGLILLVTFYLKN